jgi:5'-nucleotidase
MRILLTNDDGISAPGLAVLTRIAEHLTDDIWIVAPETNQSGASHSLTLQEPLRCRQLETQRFMVRGTPTDCIIMAVRHLMRDCRPDLVLSGVNWGANLAEDVTYSGTVAGAMEAALLGIPAIAMSLTTGFDEAGTIHWDTALKLGPDLVRRLLEAGLSSDVLVNVNFPDLPAYQVAGVAITKQGRREQQSLAIVERADPWGTPYFWFGFSKRKWDPAPGTDLRAIADGYVSVTPLHLDLTHEASLAALEKVGSRQ